MLKINPFRPNSPVNPGMFVGRFGESSKLENHLLQAQSGRPVNFLLTGERGIGKTSLLAYLKYVATGMISIDKKGFSFLVVETDIDQRVDQFTLVKKIELGLRHELGKTEKAKAFFQETWKFLQRLELGHVSLKSPAGRDHDLIIEEFAHSLAKTVDGIIAREQQSVFGSSYDGVLLLVDEADNANVELRLGSFLKLLLERLQKDGCNNFMVGLAGLPDVRRVLVESHPSSLRLFEELPLGRLTDSEVEKVIDLCLRHANSDNESQTEITESAKRKLVELSEGFPHFVQQFGYCAFEADTDGLIDDNDINAGAYGQRGGLELIGDCYYRTDFYNKIQKESYRQVLRIMAEKQDGWISKADIKQKFTGKESTLDNAIKALRERHIILSREGQRGVYRLQHRGFAMWIRLHTATLPFPEMSDDSQSSPGGELA
jgi:hypothetical protein